MVIEMRGERPGKPKGERQVCFSMPKQGGPRFPGEGAGRPLVSRQHGLRDQLSAAAESLRFFTRQIFCFAFLNSKVNSPRIVHFWPS